jgi:hypothetical protein
VNVIDYGILKKNVPEKKERHICSSGSKVTAKTVVVSREFSYRSKNMIPPLPLPNLTAHSVHIRYVGDLLLVRIHDGHSLCEYGINPDLLPIDELDLWVHEFSEHAVHSAIVDEIHTITKLPITISLISQKCFFRVPHLMVSLHTLSILRVEDVTGTIDERFVLMPNAFETLLTFKGKCESTEISDRSSSVPLKF